MLDQNTDRMWYVIGAVIVGSALIFLMNNTFPTLFANIGVTFEDKVEQTTEMTDGIRPITKPVDLRYVTSEDVFVTGGARVEQYNEDQHQWTMVVKPIREGSPWHFFSGFRMNTNRFIVPYGATVMLTYEIRVPEGTTQVKAVTDLNTRPLDETIEPWRSNDNDTDRVINGGSDPMVSVVPGEWTKITATYANTDPLNTQKVALYDTSHIGIYNTSGADVTYDIRNARLDISK